MTQYTHFLGIDVGKFNFVVSLYGTKTPQEYENSSQGFSSFLQDYKDSLDNALCVLENTGGYEQDLLYRFYSAHIPCHRVDGRKAKNFIRSLGTKAKTDGLDAQSLARYAFERADQLTLFHPPSQTHLDLFQLSQRRQELTQMKAAEKNRLQSPTTTLIRQSILSLIDFLQQEIKTVTQKIQTLIEGDPLLKEKQDILKTIPGIGELTASQLVVLLPELGTLSRRKIASLAGLAPIANDSGAKKGYRKTGFGRKGIKSILFMRAMAARNSKNSTLKAFYEKLIQKGKPKMVALIALERKIIVIANAKIKSLTNHPKKHG